MTAALEHAANDVYAHGDRVKVAVIYEPADLGSIPSLFGHPAEYARFLGLELSLWYVGPLLVVMPAGFGIYDGGRSTTAETQALQAIPLAADSPDELARSANAALEALTAAGALDSPDVRSPLVTAHPASGTRGKPAMLRFDVYDDSGRSAARVRVYDAGSLLATLVSPATFQIGTRNVAIALARAGEAPKPASFASASSPPTQPGTAALPRAPLSFGSGRGRRSRACMSWATDAALV